MTRIFSHNRSLEFCKKTRPYSSAEEMNEDIISKWNAKVGKFDPVYHLGDFSFEKDFEKNKQIFNRLNGRKHLIIGNHDKNSLKLGWNSVQDYKRLNTNKEVFILFHYPIHFHWDRAHRGSYHLHGHVHGKDMHWAEGAAQMDKELARPMALDVGWDGPMQDVWSMDEVLTYMRNI